jgi:hypothetical protein
VCVCVCAYVITDKTHENLHTLHASLVLSLIISPVPPPSPPHSVGHKWSRGFDILKAIILMFACIGIAILGHYVEPFLDQLFFFLVAGMFITNYTNAKEDFVRLLGQLSNPVFVCFFTLMGAALKLEVLGEAMLISLALVITRLISVILGTFVGNCAAKESLDVSKYMWSAYITQAGVTLGLAKRVQLEFPNWGDYFATMIVGCVLLNQMIGPPLLRWGLHRSGEVPEVDAEKSGAVIVDSEEHDNEEMISTLVHSGWNVIQVSSQSMSIIEKHGDGGGGSAASSSSEVKVSVPMTTLSPLAPKDNEVEMDKVAVCGGYFNWIYSQFILTTDIQRFMAKYKSPHLSFIYTLLLQHSPVDTFVLTNNDPAYVLKLATTIARCHKIHTKAAPRELRIIVVISSVNKSFLSDLAYISRETDQEDYVQLSVVDPKAATVNLLDLAVKGGTMASWLDVASHLKRADLTSRAQQRRASQLEKKTASRIAL